MIRLIAFFTGLALLPCIAIAESPEPQSAEQNTRLAEYGRFLVVRSEVDEPYIITGTGMWSVYASPNVDTETELPLGYIRPIGALTEPEVVELGAETTPNYVFATEHVTIKEGFLSSTEEFHLTNEPLHSVSVNQKFALPLQAVQGEWLQTSVGWVHRNEAWAEVTRITNWEQLYQSGNGSQDSLSMPKQTQYDDLTPLGDLAEMRKKTSYAPLGKVTLFANKELTRPVTTIEAPLHLTMLEFDGMTIKGFAAVPNCGIGTTQHYKEGTIGWIGILDEDGVPQIERDADPCD